MASVVLTCVGQRDGRGAPERPSSLVITAVILEGPEVLPWLQLDLGVDSCLCFFYLLCGPRPCSVRKFPAGSE